MRGSSSRVVGNHSSPWRPAPHAASRCRFRSSAAASEAVARLACSSVILAGGGPRRGVSAPRPLVSSLQSSTPPPGAPDCWALAGPLPPPARSWDVACLAKGRGASGRGPGCSVGFASGASGGAIGMGGATGAGAGGQAGALPVLPVSVGCGSGGGGGGGAKLPAAGRGGKSAGRDGTAVGRDHAGGASSVRAGRAALGPATAQPAAWHGVTDSAAMATAAGGGMATAAGGGAATATGGGATAAVGLSATEVAVGGGAASTTAHGTGSAISAAAAGTSTADLSCFARCSSASTPFSRSRSRSARLAAVSAAVRLARACSSWPTASASARVSSLSHTPSRQGQRARS